MAVEEQISLLPRWCSAVTTSDHACRPGDFPRTFNNRQHDEKWNRGKDGDKNWMPSQERVALLEMIEKVYNICFLLVVILSSWARFRRNLISGYFNFSLLTISIMKIIHFASAKTPTDTRYSTPSSYLMVAIWKGDDDWWWWWFAKDAISDNCISVFPCHLSPAGHADAVFSTNRGHV